MTHKSSIHSSEVIYPCVHLLRLSVLSYSLVIGIELCALPSSLISIGPESDLRPVIILLISDFVSRVIVPVSYPARVRLSLTSVSYLLDVQRQQIDSVQLASHLCVPRVTVLAAS